jgi:hypothetical protein
MGPSNGVGSTDGVALMLQPDSPDDGIRNCERNLAPFPQSIDGWLEVAGEVDLIGGWAEVALSREFAAAVDVSAYLVFLTSNDPVLLFVQNRTPTSFEIHSARWVGGKHAQSTRCAHRIIAPPRPPATRLRADAK